MYQNIQNNFATLGLELPVEIREAINNHQTAQKRACELRDENSSPQFDPTDLTGKDWRKKLEAEAQRATTNPRMESLAFKAATDLERKVDYLLGAQRGELVEILQEWFTANVKDLARKDDKSLGAARRDEITELGRVFSHAYLDVVGGSIGNAAPTLQGGWATTYFAFDSAAWDKLIDRTMPGMEPYREPNTYQLCLECGGTPSLVSSWKQADQRVKRLAEARKAHREAGLDAGDAARAASWAKLADIVLSN